VLLSFAQFEREVTGERIRDKIGASKRRGCGSNFRHFLFCPNNLFDRA
jgi:DNA invertase Pin-like site-specific DNA recombinase